MTLNRGEKNALRRFSRDSGSYQAVSKWKGIGLPSMRSLVEKGLVVERGGFDRPGRASLRGVD